MRLLLPQIDEQMVIATILLNDSDHEIRLLETQQNALQTQKRGLMQKLLTGQWRVNIEQEN
ncbi:hypothetical protein SIID45300_02479 [Candidatus Magnetaquicoccaceae bacterium FCR-1]|uniref:Type I restriction modification DNA specificity domain-containing protein n=1 Tax=Candidatus Magnetaquiglobus chichijimensis TaxID=3141448 RepID=A0ABQ0CBA2_9PROT